MNLEIFHFGWKIFGGMKLSFKDKEISLLYVVNKTEYQKMFHIKIMVKISVFFNYTI